MSILLLFCGGDNGAADDTESASSITSTWGATIHALMKDRTRNFLLRSHSTAGIEALCMRETQMSNRRSRLFSRAFLLSDRCILRITIEMRGIQNWSSYREELLVFAILLSTQSVPTTTITLSFRVDPC